MDGPRLATLRSAAEWPLGKFFLHVCQGLLQEFFRDWEVSHRRVQSLKQVLFLQLLQSPHALAA